MSESSWISTAPSEPGVAERVERARQAFLTGSSLAAMIEAVPDPAVVLNAERRIVAANRTAAETFGVGNEDFLVGQLFGSVAGCSSARPDPPGCGTAAACSICGARRAVVQAFTTGTQAREECRITARGDGAALDLKVVATPFRAGDTDLVFAVMKDISAEKRRRILEHTFLHDVLNTVSGLYGLASSLAAEELSPGEEREYTGWMLELTKDLSEEVQHHRVIMMAERGEFVPEYSQTTLPTVMSGLHVLYRNHAVSKDRLLRLLPVPDTTITTDLFLLRRVLGNLIKNAMEAVPPGGTVTLACERGEHHVHFRVHNPGVMPESVQLQVFQRSFSTKASEGRGIGTYSVKLFGEKYLKGKVGFVSREPEGTTFTFSLPIC